MKKFLVSILCALTLIASTGVDAAIALRAVGTSSTATGGGAATPGIPAGTAANDILVAVVISTTTTVPTTPAGWTQKLATTNATNHVQTILWKRATGSDTAPSITGQQFEVLAQIAAFSGCITTGDPFSAASAQANASSTTVTAPSITPANANEMILFAASWTTQGASSASFSGYSGTNPTFTEAFDVAQGAGVVYNVSTALAYGLKTDTTATGSRTATESGSADLNTGALLSLIPDTGGGGGGTVVNPISGKGGAAARPIVRNQKPMTFDQLLASLRAETAASIPH